MVPRLKSIDYTVVTPDEPSTTLVALLHPWVTHPATTGKQALHCLTSDTGQTHCRIAVKASSHSKPVYVSVWFDFCFTALQHILGHFGHGQLT